MSPCHLTLALMLSINMNIVKHLTLWKTHTLLHIYIHTLTYIEIYIYTHMHTLYIHLSHPLALYISTIGTDVMSPVHVQGHCPSTQEKEFHLI